MVKKWFPTSMALLLSISIAVGCSKSSPSSDPPPASAVKNDAAAVPVIPSEPLTLKIYQHSANISDDEFKTLIAEPVKKKFPNITMELMRVNPKFSREDLISSGEFPDFIFTNTTVLQEYMTLKLPLDLNPLIKKYNIDTGRFQERYLNDIKAYADNGQLYGFPFSTNFDALYYNKDIFDKFAVPYPKDGMTWDEAIQLGKMMTREIDGVQYVGLHPTLMRYFSTQLSLPFVNPKTLKAELTTDGWKRALETYKAISDASGVMNTNVTLGLFNKDRKLAMMAHYGARIGELEQLHREGNPMNWDMVTYPVFKDKPGISQGADTHYLMISSTSKNAETAFQVLQLLVSDEIQTANARKARLTALKNPKIKEQFGADIQTLQGKNIQAIFKSTPAPLPIPTRYDDHVKNNAQAIVNDMLAGKMDINTALRTIEDKANQLIEADKRDKK